jgi:hypothetical protein
MVGEKQTVLVQNYSGSVVRFGRHILINRESTITKASIFTHEQFLDNLYYEKCVSWLTLLKSAVEVFNGTITGFSDISDEKSDRAKELMPSMKKILMDIMESLLKDR